MRTKISRLHCLTWDGAGIDHLEQVRQLVEAGADLIQLRQKSGSYEEKLGVAKEAAHICRDVGITLIVNDDPQLCIDSGAHGVHLGLSDMPIKEARALLGRFAIIGGTANTPEQVLQRLHEGADYVGLGPWRATSTKEKLSPVLGPSGVQAAMRALREAESDLPVLVIGGVTPDDVTPILELGAHGVAVSSAIVAAPDIDRAYTEFYMQIHRKDV